MQFSILILNFSEAIGLFLLSSFLVFLQRTLSALLKLKVDLAEVKNNFEGLLRRVLAGFLMIDLR